MQTFSTLRSRWYLLKDVQPKEGRDILLAYRTGGRWVYVAVPGVSAEDLKRHDLASSPFYWCYLAPPVIEEE